MTQANDDSVIESDVECKVKRNLKTSIPTKLVKIIGFPIGDY